jgi:hypothetical protein
MMYSKVFFNDRRLLSGVLWCFWKVLSSLIKEINILKMDKLWLKLQKMKVI